MKIFNANVCHNASSSPLREEYTLIGPLSSPDDLCLLHLRRSLKQRHPP